MLLYEMWKNITDEYTAIDQEFNAKLYLSIDGIYVYAGIDSQNKLHLIISDIQNSVFDDLQVKGLLISKRKLIINDEEKKYYIDIFCDITISDKLHTPFISFCNDLISSIKNNHKNLYQIIKKIFFKWKYFWDNSSVNDFSENWIKGLFGELYILNIIIHDISKSGVLTWQGPYGKDVDFQGYNCGLEIKTTSSKPAIVTINNIKQLDNENFDTLYLCIVSLEFNKHGISINQVIDEIVEHLEMNGVPFIESFYERLTSSGYYLYDKSRYNEYLYLVNSIECYLIDDNFPSLTFSKLKDILDYRIKNIKYQIEILDLEKKDIHDLIITNFLKY